MSKNIPACSWSPYGGYNPSDTYQTPYEYGGPSGYFAGYGNSFVAPGPSPYGAVGCAPFMASPYGMAPFGAPPYPMGPDPTKAQCVKETPEPYAPFPGTKGPSDRRRGVQYLFPQKHTFIHVVNAEKFPKPWERVGQRFSYEIFQVDCGISVPGLIKRLGGDEKAVVTEFIEMGDGHWA